ncbi:pentatricopeptide repeat-containing protein At2g02980, chloroplastic-like [Typha latifolia]|uniref:pentatricopeptide repeat-containing protein At2g02980, chloroplastic-like n=1 Tax=Typha latifolia TaxID=4733 RepID=UPI003C2ADAA5
MDASITLLFPSPSLLNRQPIDHHFSSIPKTPALAFPPLTNNRALLYKPLQEAQTLTLSLNPAQAHLSLPRLIKLCSRSRAFSSGIQLHALSFKLGLSSDPFLQSSLISFYSSCDLPCVALQLFDTIPQPNVVAWTAAIVAWLRAKDPNFALSLFAQMVESGVEADDFALVAVLSACADLGSLKFGRALHGYAEKTGTVISAFLGTSLVDMYCKCSSVEDAVKVFDSLPENSRPIQIWNAMIHGLAVHGHGFRVLQLFDEMLLRGLPPNDVTFVGILCGCAHSGLIQDGRYYFNAMRDKFGIEPTVKHYGCMVDLLGRAGLLDEAVEMITSMQVSSNHIVLGALLSACSACGDVGTAEQVVARIVREECSPKGDTSHFVILSNMYRAAESSGKVVGVRAMVGRKPKGKSWIEVEGQMHEF